MKDPRPFASALVLSLAACSAPLHDAGVQDRTDPTLSEIQDLYEPDNPQVYVEEGEPGGDLEGPDELTSYAYADPIEEGERWHGEVTFPIGYQSADRFGEVDDLASLGLFDFALQPAGSPVSLVVQLLAGFSSELPDEGPGSAFPTGDNTSISQFNLGLRHVWRSGRVQPYVGGGVSFVTAGVYGDDERGYYDEDLDSDSDFAGWAGAGVYFTSRSGFLMGINAQYLFDADVELAGTAYALDGLSAAFLIGYGF